MTEQRVRPRWIIVADSIEADDSSQMVRHALPADKQSEHPETLCGQQKPSDGWETSGFTSITHMIGCSICRAYADAERAGTVRTQ
jgi:hypothetical protein